MVITTRRGSDGQNGTGDVKADADAAVVGSTPPTSASAAAGLTSAASLRDASSAIGERRRQPLQYITDSHGPASSSPPIAEPPPPVPASVSPRSSPPSSDRNISDRSRLPPSPSTLKQTKDQVALRGGGSSSRRRPGAFAEGPSSQSLIQERNKNARQSSPRSAAVTGSESLTTKGQRPRSSSSTSAADGDNTRLRTPSRPGAFPQVPSTEEQFERALRRKIRPGGDGGGEGGGSSPPNDLASTAPNATAKATATATATGDSNRDRQQQCPRSPPAGSGSNPGASPQVPLTEDEFESALRRKIRSADVGGAVTASSIPTAGSSDRKPGAIPEGASQSALFSRKVGGSNSPPSLNAGSTVANSPSSLTRNRGAASTTATATVTPAGGNSKSDIDAKFDQERQKQVHRDRDRDRDRGQQCPRSPPVGGSTSTPGVSPQIPSTEDEFEIALRRKIRTANGAATSPNGVSPNQQAYHGSADSRVGQSRSPRATGDRHGAKKPGAVPEGASQSALVRRKVGGAQRPRSLEAGPATTGGSQGSPGPSHHHRSATAAATGDAAGPSDSPSSPAGHRGFAMDRSDRDAKARGGRRTSSATATGPGAFCEGPESPPPPPLEQACPLTEKLHYRAVSTSSGNDARRLQPSSSQRQESPLTQKMRAHAAAASERNVSSLSGGSRSGLSLNCDMERTGGSPASRAPRPGSCGFSNSTRAHAHARLAALDNVLLEDDGNDDDRCEHVAAAARPDRDAKAPKSPNGGNGGTRSGDRDADRKASEEEATATDDVSKREETSGDVESQEKPAAVVNFVTPHQLVLGDDSSDEDYEDVAYRGVDFDCAPSVEFLSGIAGKSGEENLAVAVPVLENEPSAYLPEAVEFDPDSKPHPLYRSRRFYFYAALFMFVLAGIAVVVSLAISMRRTADAAAASAAHSSWSPTQAPTTEREGLGIASMIERSFGKEMTTFLADPDSAYSKALLWVTNEDPMQLSPDAPNFFRRYLLASLYFATTEDGPWRSCNPPNVTAGETSFCVYRKFVPDGLKISRTMPSKRWLSNTTECVWAGVKCEGELGVRALRLHYNELSGPFPEGIVYFPFLKAVDFGRGRLRGPLPASVARMKHLLSIELQENQFSGEIPSEWWKATNLQQIDVSYNLLNGTIPSAIGGLKDLKSLFLNGNSFSGSLPHEIGELASLTFFNVAKNSFSGTLPTSIGRFVQVEQFVVHDNSLSGSLPTEIGNMARLFQFRAENNRLSGQIPEEFWNNTMLGKLDLFNNNFNGTIGSGVGRLQKLDCFRIRNNEFVGSIPAALGLIPYLKVAWLRNNLFDGEVPSELCDKRGILKQLGADCEPSLRTRQPEVTCAEGCCTTCCDPDGNCYEKSSDIGVDMDAYASTIC